MKRNIAEEIYVAITTGAKCENIALQDVHNAILEKCEDFNVPEKDRPRLIGVSEEELGSITLETYENWCKKTGQQQNEESRKFYDEIVRRLNYKEPEKVKLYLEIDQGGCITMIGGENVPEELMYIPGTELIIMSREEFDNTVELNNN